jgi:transcription elongation GreA/GreB family factor
MHKALLVSAALFGVVVTAPVMTQATVTPPAPGAATSGAPAPGGATQEQTTSQPANNKPVEHGPAASKRRPHQGVQRRSVTAPHSTTSSVDENASADQYLRDAQTALRGRRIREAQEALERAETRVLNGAPDTNVGQNSTVNTIERAREALGHVRYVRPDSARGGQMIDQAMSEVTSTSSLSGGQSGSTNSTNGNVGSSK